MSKMFLHREGSPKRALVMIVSAGLASSNGAMAADTTYVKSIDEVSVTANRITRSAIIPSQHIDGERLRQMSVHNAADAVRYFSGVQVKDYGGVGGMKTVDIRSMGTNHVGVFYDGLQIGNAQNGTVDLGKFSLDNMEAIAVYNGQKSDLLQPAKDYGASGSIYLRTRRPAFDGHKSINASTSFRTGSFGLANPSVLVEGRLTDRLSISTNAEYTYANGRYDFSYHKVYRDANGRRVSAWDTTGVRQNGDVHAIRTEINIFGNTRGGSMWQGKTYFYDSERGIPRAIVRNMWTSDQHQWDRNFFCQTSIQTSGERVAAKMGIKYSRDYLRYLNPDTTQLYVDNHFTQHEAYATGALTLSFTDRMSVGMAQDWSRNWMRSDMVGFPLPVRISSLTAFALRYEGIHFRLQGSLLENIIHDEASRGALPTGDHRHTMHKMTPAVMASAPIGKHLTLRAFAKRAFRMPTFNDLYYTDLGNTSLRPETANQLNAGLEFALDRFLESSVDIYHNTIDDKIVAIPKGNSQYRWMMMNIGRVEISGLDAKCRTSITIGDKAKMGACLSYTFQRAQDMSDPEDNGPRGTYGGQISYIPRHSGSAILDGQWQHVSLNYSFIYVGERYHVSANIPENLEPAWYTHDIALRYNTSHLSLGLEANNVLNQQYDVVLNYPMPGRNYKIIIKFEL